MTTTNHISQPGQWQRQDSTLKSFKCAAHLHSTNLLHGVIGQSKEQQDSSRVIKKQHVLLFRTLSYKGFKISRLGQLIGLGIDTAQLLTSDMFAFKIEQG